MKKKRLMAVLALAMISFSVFGLTACEEKHKHEWNEYISKQATCSEKGEVLYSCDCGENYTVATSALGHKIKSIQAKAPTCTEIGWYAYEICERSGCDYTTYEEIKENGHTFQKGVCIVEGCGVKEPPENHTTHEWDEGVVTTAPTCTEKGIKTFTCWCSEKYTQAVAELGHDREQHEAQEATCVAVGWEAYETCKRDDCDYTTYVEIEINPDNHDYVNGVCSHCNEKEYYSAGLEYALLGDGTSYMVTGIGTCADTKIVIPSTYNNLPVTSIGGSAFYLCSSLTKIVIPDSVTSIGDSAFVGCISLTKIVIGDSVTSIGNYAFVDCSSLTEIVIPDGVTSIGDSAFSDCSNLTKVVIGDSVTSIGYYAFYECSSLTKVVIGDSVTSIGGYAFYGCSSLTSITYNGTVEQWNAIEKDAWWKGNVPATEVVCSDGRVSI